jgi:hypothetical protein
MMDDHPDNHGNPAPAGRVTTQHIDPVKALKDRYPAMFAGELISFDAYRGWFALLVRLCADIDAALGENKAVFRWVQIKEKFGTYRLYYDLDDDAPMALERVPGAGHLRLRSKPVLASGAAPIPLAHQIRALVSRAEDATNGMCMACGQPAGVRSFGGNYLNLCELHAPDMNIPRSDPRFAAMWENLWRVTVMPDETGQDQNEGKSP